VVTEPFGVESGRDFDEILRVVDRPRSRAEHPGKVAIIGAGPAGLSCAHDLALMGHRVVVYDAAPVAGGMLRLGVPEYRLPREVLQAEVDFIEHLGVEIKFGVEIGGEITFERLVEGHDAVFVATGCRKGRHVRVPGGDLQGVLTAVDFLARVNLGIEAAIGQRVVVIGGGNVAYDVARTARRFG
jgi:NADPH-dependent glutamate synthase beta subunit-like oxidoreductase